MESKCWKERLDAVTWALDDAIKGSNLKGYVQFASTQKEFLMILILDLQLECIHSVKPELRVAFFDASGGLNHIPGKEFKKTQNYIFIFIEILRKWTK